MIDKTPLKGQRDRGNNGKRPSLIPADKRPRAATSTLG